MVVTPSPSTSPIPATARPRRGFERVFRRSQGRRHDRVEQAAVDSDRVDRPDEIATLEPFGGGDQEVGDPVAVHVAERRDPTHFVAGGLAVDAEDLLLGEQRGVDRRRRARKRRERRADHGTSSRESA